MPLDIYIGDLFRALNLVLCSYAIVIAILALHVRYKVTHLRAQYYMVIHPDESTQLTLNTYASVVICVATMVDTFQRFSMPMTWRAPTYFVAFLLFALAKFFLYRRQVAIKVMLDALIKKTESEIELSGAPDSE